MVLLKWMLVVCLVVIVHVATVSTASDRPEHVVLTQGEESETYEVPCLQWKYFKVDVTEACKDLEIVVNHQQGEPNVYVSRGATKYPTENSLAWSSNNWGSEYLTISSWDPEFIVGTFYIGVHAFCGDDVDTGYTAARFTVKASSVESVHPHEEIIANETGIMGQVEKNGYSYFRFCIPDSCVNAEVTLTNCNDPESCPTSYAWPELLVSRSIMVPTVKDHAWKLADASRRSVKLEHNDPEFYPGHYFVGVYGWCTPAEHCPDPSTCGPCDNYPIFYSVSLVVKEITSGCIPKEPLGLCEGGGSSAVQVSLLVLALTTLSTIINM